jgi:hypothetical protein
MLGRRGYCARARARRVRRCCRSATGQGGHEKHSCDPPPCLLHAPRPPVERARTRSATTTTTEVGSFVCRSGHGASLPRNRMASTRRLEVGGRRDHRTRFATRQQRVHQLVAVSVQPLHGTEIETVREHMHQAHFVLHLIAATFGLTGPRLVADAGRLGPNAQDGKLDWLGRPDVLID